MTGVQTCALPIWAARKSLFDRVLALRTKLATGAGVTPPQALGAIAKARLDAFREALEDDLSTPRALAELWGVLKDQNVPLADALGAAFDMDRVLGLGLADIKELVEPSVDPVLAAEIEALVTERAEAKKSKDWVRADAIRNELKERGIILEDGPGGTSWKLDRNV